MAGPQRGHVEESHRQSHYGNSRRSRQCAEHGRPDEYKLTTEERPRRRFTATGKGSVLLFEECRYIRFTLLRCGIRPIAQRRFQRVQKT
jgi:hypothetical protein